MFLKELTIEEYVKKLGVEVQPNAAIWGTIKPSNISGALLGGISVLELKYNIIYFAKNEIIIIAISKTTGKLIEGEHVVINKKSIQLLQFKKKLLGYILEIKTSDGGLCFKVNSKMIGAKWHQVNVQNVLKGVI